jgi:hypothetical protein
MTYTHMTVLFWLYVGLATATILVQQAERGNEAKSAAPQHFPVAATAMK